MKAKVSRVAMVPLEAEASLFTPRDQGDFLLEVGWEGQAELNRAKTGRVVKQKKQQMPRH